MHFQRWITGIIAIPILIYIIGFGPRWIFYILLFLISLTSLYEFYKITSSDLSKQVQLFAYLLTFLLFVILFSGQILYALIIISLFAIAPMTLLLFRSPRSGANGTSDIAKTVMGPIYICFPLALLLPIDRLSVMYYPYKGIWIFFLLAVIFANDTGAYYCGKIFGKHLLYETVSPNKTWEGAVGGLVFSMMAGILFLYLFHHYPINPPVVALIFVLSIIGQIGDLSESMLKRNHGKKDSGKILPGHGGMLDRIDSLLFSIPFLYLFLLWSLP